MADGWLWEERRTFLHDGAAANYRALYLKSIWPWLAARGARPLLLANGLIGAPATAFIAMTGYPDFATYTRIQEEFASAMPERADLIHEERVRLLRDCGERPRREPHVGDRRAVYGVRSFVIRARDWPEFVRLSVEGVWRRIETQDARILGMFRDIAATEPLDVLLLTGYHGPAHWEATRGFDYPPPPGYPTDEWQRAVELSRARARLLLRSSVTLMQAHWPD